MRKISLLLLAVCLCITLGGCFPVSQLNDRILIQAIAIDYENGLFDVTLQYFVAPSGDNNTDVTGAALISGQGENLSEAVSLHCRAFKPNAVFWATTVCW